MFRDGVTETMWGIPELFSNAPLHGTEYFDHTSDECIAWAFVVLRDGYADVEELFVRPAYRGKGYGTRLATGLLNRSRLDDVPLRLWISHPDVATQNQPALTRIIETLELSIRPTAVRWAAAQATAALI
jgi:GNAT superfamily N-acetyltransferase